MKKYFHLIIHIIAFGIIVYLLNLINNQKILLSKYKIEDSTLLSMMIENENGEYKESENNEWPSNGYILNTERSGCENGGTLEYQDNNVYVKAASSDRCYVYFAIDNATNRCLLNYEESLVCDLIKSKDNSLIYHDGKADYENMPNSNLEAGDLSYRFVGASPNNYVCFGGDCSNDPNNAGYKYLYRIIGLFKNGDKYEAKIIKADGATKEDLGDKTTDGSAYYGELSFDLEYYKGKLQNDSTFYWNTSSNGNVNMWKNSNLNNINLNQFYYNKIDSAYKKMIEKHTWQVGGIPEFNGNAKTVYDYELGSNQLTVESNNCYTQGNTTDKRICSEPNDLTYNAYVGLIYANDYLYATLPEYWTETAYNYKDDDVKNNDWLYLGTTEWTISRHSNSGDKVWRIYYSGHFANYNTIDTPRSVRPVLYLSSNVKITGGFGTETNPYKLSL